MSKPTYTRIGSSNPELETVQDNNEDTVRGLADIPFLTGKLIKSIDLDNSATTKVLHNLGYNFTGYIVLSRNAAQHVFLDLDTRVDKTRQIPLKASNAVTVDLWVF